MKSSAVFVLLAAVFWGSDGVTEAASPVKNDVCTHPFVDINGRCLFINNFAQMDWDAARTFCGGFQSDLVTLDEANLLADIVDFINKEGLTERSYWIGGSDQALEGEWTWTDGTSVRMGTPTWGADGQSQHPTGGNDENCVGLDKDNFFFFNDFSCSSEISLICELKL
ncbi:C-type lectin domain family 17, member A-like [Penaeus monodon]|uniref:C-type lectin domain family 17, member A-like n=1 Tax=Penaeus monodon TaxID=6687 RepID=UPI0018A77C09|nr:C-type lectin domain family 17, member A-like [Penaeus monodon]